MANIAELFEQLKKNMQEIVDRFTEEVNKLRIGAVNVENAKSIMVDAYGAKMPLYQVATLNAPNAMTLIVTPWDKNLLKSIADAISDFYKGEITPTIKDNAIYVNFPPITKEKQQEYFKLIKDLAEKYRQRLRDARNEVKNKIEEAKQEHEITEDEYYKSIEELDKVTREYVDSINEIYEHKKAELE